MYFDKNRNTIEPRRASVGDHSYTLLGPDIYNGRNAARHPPKIEDSNVDCLWRMLKSDEITAGTKAIWKDQHKYKTEGAESWAIELMNR